MGPYETLLYIIRRKRRLEAVSIVLLFNCSCAVLLYLILLGQSTGVSIWLAVGSMALSVLLFTSWILKRNRLHPMLKILKDRSSDVVWVYWHKTENMPFGINVFTFHKIFIHLNDGRHFILSLQAAEVEQVTVLFKQSFSRASFGYSLEREQLYKINPDLVSRD